MSLVQGEVGDYPTLSIEEVEDDVASSVSVTGAGLETSDADSGPSGAIMETVASLTRAVRGMEEMREKALELDRSR
jgi:hypothetical protein